MGFPFLEENCFDEVLASSNAQLLGSLQSSCGAHSLLFGLPVTFVTGQTGRLQFLMHYPKQRFVLYMNLEDSYSVNLVKGC